MSEETVSRAVPVPEGFNRWDFWDWDGVNLNPPPSGHVLIHLWRCTWDRPVLVYRDEIDPSMNVAGLYWRMTGIGREEIARPWPGILQWTTARKANHPYGVSA